MEFQACGVRKGKMTMIIGMIYGKFDTKQRKQLDCVPMRDENTSADQCIFQVSVLTILVRKSDALRLYRLEIFAKISIVQRKQSWCSSYFFVNILFQVYRPLH